MQGDQSVGGIPFGALRVDLVHQQQDGTRCVPKTHPPVGGDYGVQEAALDLQVQDGYDFTVNGAVVGRHVVPRRLPLQGL